MHTYRVYFYFPLERPRQVAKFVNHLASSFSISNHVVVVIVFNAEAVERRAGHCSVVRVIATGSTGHATCVIVFLGDVLLIVSRGFERRARGQKNHILRVLRARFVRLGCRLVGWFIGRFVSLLVDRLISWFICRLFILLRSVGFPIRSINWFLLWFVTIEIDLKINRTEMGSVGYQKVRLVVTLICRFVVVFVSRSVIVLNVRMLVIVFISRLIVVLSYSICLSGV